MSCMKKWEGKPSYSDLRAVSDTDADSDGEQEPKSKKPRRIQRECPMIIAICTPLMSRVHESIQQAGEVIQLLPWTDLTLLCLFCP